MKNVFTSVVSNPAKNQACHWSSSFDYRVVIMYSSSTLVSSVAGRRPWYYYMELRPLDISVIMIQ